jgi:hypothetical protein
MVKDFVAGYSNFARSQWETGWAIDIVTSAPQNVTQDYADALIDAASIRNQGAFATVSKLTAINATTFIADAAIGSAQIADAAISNAKIDRASVNKLQVVTADIVDLSVDTFKIAGNAVVIPVGVQVPLTTQGSGASPLSASINMSGSSVNSKIIVTVCISSLEANAGTGGQSDLTIRDELGTVYPWVYGHYWYYTNESYSENYHYGLNVYQFVVTSNALKTFTVYVDNNADSTTFSGSLTLLGAKSSV